MKSLLFSLSLVSLNAWTQSSALTSDFKNLLKKYSVGTANEQAYCYKQNEQVAGFQVEKLQRIASVTKLFTTYFASETLDLHQRFTTTIYISGDQMHIEGSRDPYFEEEKLLLLMQALNDAGYKSFSKVTFNKDFYFYDVALGAHIDIQPSQVRSRLAAYLNAKNAKLLKEKWAMTVNFAKEEGVDLDKATIPSLNATKVEIVESNPLINENTVVLKHESKPLHAILKSMNVMSKNVVAQNVFLESSKVKTFASFMAEKGFSKGSFKIYNGSGLPIKGKNRIDNLASCRVVLEMISSLEKSLAKHNLKLSDVVAVNGGQDLGSFRRRFENWPETHEAVISKTGTLNQASTLAGVLLMDQSTPFAILNHTTNVASSRKFQDNFVSRMFHHLGEAIPTDYTKISIFPWDDAEFLVPVVKTSPPVM